MPSSTRTCADIGEDELIASLSSILPSSSPGVTGIGDDCAVISREDGTSTLLKVDAIQEGVHYFPGTDPKLIGRKAVARVASDMAAMGGSLDHILVTLACSPETLEKELLSIYEGMQQFLAECGASIVGGETTSLAPGAPLLLSISGEGKALKPILRSGGQADDILYVTGELGGSLDGHHLTFQPRIEEGQWLSKNAPPSAMMDLSDGLAQDLPRLAKASQTGYQIAPEKLPRKPHLSIHHAMTDGEDYELLFALSPSLTQTLEQHWPFDTPLTRIGRLTTIEDSTPFTQTGWQHFTDS